MIGQQSLPQAASYLGVRIVRGCVEIHGVNSCHEVVLQGWFPRDDAVSLISNRPASLIAVDESAFSAELAASWKILGHSIIVIPPSAGRPARRARDLCQLGVTLTATLN